MSYTVHLDNFNGPLDLLLYLIKQEEVEIHEVPIKVICDRYFEYLKNLESLDIDVSSEFLVMAATLMLIKSRALLPTEEAVDLEEELDPEDELIQQLLEYKRFKMASRDLREMSEERKLIFPHVPPKREKDKDEEIELEDLDLWDLVKAFATLLRETGLDRQPRLIHDEKPLRAYISEVFESLRHRKTVTFSGLFEGAKDRGTVVGRFVALLELARRKRIRVVQVGSYDEIDVELVDDRDLTEEEFEVMEADQLPPAPEMKEELGSTEVEDVSEGVELLDPPTRPDRVETEREASA